MMIGRHPVKLSLLLIVLMFDQMTRRDCLENENYFQLFCSFLKFSYQCVDYFRSKKHALIPLSLQLNFKEDCQFNNHTIENIFFRSSGDTIFTYSVFNFKLEPVFKPPNEPFNLTKNTYRAYPRLPLSELTVALNNKNLPIIFFYLPIKKSKNQMSDFSQLKLSAFFGGLSNRAEASKKILFNNTNFIEKTHLGQRCARLKAPGSEMKFPIRSIQRNYSSLLNSSTVSVGSGLFISSAFNHNFSLPNFSANHKKAEAKPISLDERQAGNFVAPDRKIIFENNNFNAYLHLPLESEKKLLDNTFIFRQNARNDGLVLDLKFRFEDVTLNLNDLMNEKFIDSLEGSIVIQNCAKFNRSAAYTIYDCHVSIEFNQLDCVCRNRNLVPYFNYIQFVSIYVLLLFLVFFMRLSRVFVEYFNRILLFERTKADRTLYILCSNRSALFDYILTFELGCPTPSFDLETTCIDFELQGPDSRTMTQGRILSGYFFNLTS